MSFPALQRSGVDLLVVYSIGSDEKMPSAITEAFRSIDFDPHEQETVIEDWIDGDAINRLCQTSERHLRVTTIIWNYPVIITPEEIQILDKQTDR